MKVIAFNGSPRKDGNTAALIAKVFEALAEEGIETQMIQLGGNAVRGCIACYQCFDKKDCLCSQKNDMINDCIAAMRGADAIILGSPTYFGDLTPELKALIDRSGLVSRANGNFLRRKVGAAVVAVRRAGALHAFDSINHFFLIGEMIVPGSTYWNISIGRNKGEVAGDEEGMATMKALGQNIAWLLKKTAQ
ncbi:MAG: flavodoxin family protein [Planctomycetaceae bacterium]|nr:flavodoxin family protein [Planctomycetaceae bacterium]